MNLKEKKYLLLDLDGVCYGKHNNYSLERVFGQVSKRMTQFISEKLKIDKDKAKELQTNYFYKYNTSLRGLMVHNEISSSEILVMIKDETITEGMIPKINACLDAVNNGDTEAGIINGTKQHSCLWEIFSDKGSGTLIRK